MHANERELEKEVTLIQASAERKLDPNTKD